MDLGKLINFPLLSCGLVGICMIMMAVLAFMKSRHKITNRTGIIIIVVALLLVMIALSVAEN